MQGQTNGQSIVDYIGENGNIMIVNPLKQGKDARKVFSFNKVFGQNVSHGISYSIELDLYYPSQLCAYIHIMVI